MIKEQSLSLSEAIECARSMHNSGQLQKAYDLYMQILQKFPENMQVTYLLGLLAMQTSNYVPAKNLFLKVLAHNPANIDARYLLAVIHREVEEYDSAIENLQQLLNINPDHANARRELGTCFQQLQKPQQAIDEFKIALQLNPDDLKSAGNLLTLYMYYCYWQELENFAPTMDRLNKYAIKNNIEPGEILSTNIARIDNAKVNLQLAKAHSLAIQRKISGSAPFQFTERKKPKKKLNIGYVCNNFNNHPTAHLICRLFENYDRNSFNFVAYSHGKADEYYYPQIKAGCSKVENIIQLDDRQAAQLIYNDEIDILIDLKGHTPQARLGIFAHRPAPLQITYLGFPGSSGADFFDYVLTDEIVTPPQEAANYSEKFFYMPDCYQINDSNQAISSRIYSRQDMGLPGAGFVFASFNQNYKIDPQMFDVWCRLLHKTPGSVLWLLKSSEIASQKLIGEAQKRGIDSTRLIFADIENNKQEHLARIRLADLALDTRICGGHTTSSDMLWSGVPIVTLMGKHFASRVCSSLLSAIKLPELITNSLDEYEKLCLELAGNEEKFNSIKSKLAANRLSTPLFDTKVFVDNLENGFRRIWEEFVSSN